MEGLIKKTIFKILSEYDFKYRSENVFSIIPGFIYVIATFLIMSFIFLLTANVINSQIIVLLFFCFLFIFILVITDLIFNTKNIYNYVSYKDLTEIETIAFDVIKELNLLNLYQKNKGNKYLFYQNIDKLLVAKKSLNCFKEYIDYSLKRIDSLPDFEIALLSLISLNSNLIKEEIEEKLIKLLFLKNQHEMIHIMINKSNKGNKSIIYLDRYRVEVNKTIGAEHV